MRTSTIALIVCAAVAALFAVFFLRRAEAQATTSKPISELQPGPIRHASLPTALDKRVVRLESVFWEVYPRSHEEWLDGFRRDLNPESEVAIWEAIAYSYANFISKNELSADARNEAFGLLLVRSGTNEKNTLSGLTLRFLSHAQAVELIQSYSVAHKPIQVSK